MENIKRIKDILKQDFVKMCKQSKKVSRRKLAWLRLIEVNKLTCSISNSQCILWL